MKGRTISDSRRSTEFGTFFLNLNGQFSSGSHNKNDRTITGSEKGLGVDVNHGRESERDGLSGSSSRNGAMICDLGSVLIS
jgi:hypothetical protein